MISEVNGRAHLLELNFKANGLQVKSLIQSIDSQF